MKRQANAGLFCELYWGANLAEAWSFGPEQPHVVAAPDETASLPLYGFTLPEGGFLLAERTEAGYRVYVPPQALVERSQHRDGFRQVPTAQLPQHEGRAYVELTEGTALRLREGELELRVEPSVARDTVGRYKPSDFAWLGIVATLFLSMPVGFLLAGPSPERMAESNARALEAARQKEEARRRALGLDTPRRSQTPQERAQHQQDDGGTRLRLPASFSVH